MRTRAAVATAAMLLLAAPAAFAHQGNPNYRSRSSGSRPPRPGVRVVRAQLRRQPRAAEHQRRDGRRSTATTTSRTRACSATGRSQVNTNSPAYYLNEDRFGDVDGAGGPRRRPARTGRSSRQHRAASSGTTTACTGWSKARPAAGHGPRRAHAHLRLEGPDHGRRPGRARSPARCSWIPLPGGSMPVGAIVAARRCSSSPALIAVAVVAPPARRAGQAAEAW